jgi:hypothetical protein
MTWTRPAVQPPSPKACLELHLTCLLIARKDTHPARHTALTSSLLSFRGGGENPDFFPWFHTRPELTISSNPPHRALRGLQARPDQVRVIITKRLWPLDAHLVPLSPCSTTYWVEGLHLHCAALAQVHTHTTDTCTALFWVPRARPARQ